MNKHDWIPNKNYTNQKDWPPADHPLSHAFHNARFNYPTENSRTTYENIVDWLTAEEEDTRVSVELELTEAEQLILMKMAHDRDITLNELIEVIISEAMTRHEIEDVVDIPAMLSSVEEHNRQLIDGLVQIYSLDEADGHELKLEHAFEAVGIADNTLRGVGLDPRDEYTRYHGELSQRRMK